jgi:hypothetical protein
MTSVALAERDETTGRDETERDETYWAETFARSWDSPDGQAVRAVLRERNTALYLRLMREDRRRRLIADPGWHPRTRELLLDETPWDAERMAAEFGVEPGAVWAWLKPRRNVGEFHPSLLEPDLEPEFRGGRPIKVCTAGWARENYLTSLKGRVDLVTGEIVRGRHVYGRPEGSGSKRKAH